jgi:DNA-3-methyladenine glycosylase II
MKRLIPQFGDACLVSRGDAFVTLARSIVGQQISVKAAQSVWNKFAALSKKITPAGVLKLKVDDMRAAGLSARKVEYLVDLAWTMRPSLPNWSPFGALAVGRPRCF